MIIRPEQIESLRRAALSAFEEEMVAHSREFTPRLCEVLGDEQLRVALREGIEQARSYGFTNRGTVRLFIELRFLFGSGFDSDCQYPWAAEILSSEDDQMQRAERLYAKTLDYQEKVSGPDAVNTRNALKHLATLIQQPAPQFTPDFDADMLAGMTRVFPQKAAYVGESGLRTLIRIGRAEARKYKFPPVRGEGLLVILMFAFGQGCTDDPLYPWIARTLQDERTIDPAGRAERLEEKSRIWLTHVVERFSKETQK
jgi:hypothetical protein